MSAVRIIVPGKPVAKGRPRLTTINGHARAFTPDRTVRYENLVATAGAGAMNGAAPLEGALAVTLTAYFQLPKGASKARRVVAAEGRDWHTCRPDGDNIIKAACDALNGIVWRDDAQVASVQIVKLYQETPRLEIEVRHL